MEISADTLVINDISHPYILPAVLIIFFGSLLLYNIYCLLSYRKRMRKLSEAEGMIISGHTKLVDNREELFVDGIGVLDASFMDDQIQGNMDAIREGNSETYRKRAEKARIRAEKRKIKQEKRNAAAERKKEAKARKIISPERKLKKAEKNERKYDVSYKMLLIDADRHLKTAQTLLADFSEDERKYLDYLTSKYGNKAAKKHMEERKQAEAEKAAKKEKAKQKKQIQKAKKKADADLFTKKKGEI